MHLLHLNYTISTKLKEKHGKYWARAAQGKLLTAWQAWISLIPLELEIHPMFLFEYCLMYNVFANMTLD